MKETIYCLSNNNHINGISYRLPHIWFPALKLKGGSEVNTSSNQNEETNNQSQANSVSTQVRHWCIKESTGQQSPFDDGHGERILMLTLKQADVRLEYKARVRFALPYSWPNINWIVA